MVPLGREPGGRARRWKREGGELEQTLPPLRRRGVGELVDMTFEILRARFWIIFATSVAIWMPLRLLQPFFGMHRAQESENPMFMGGALLLTGLAPHVAQTIISSLVALFVYASIQGYEVRTKSVMMYAAKRAFALALLTFVSTMVVWVGTLACCVPGILLMWKFYLAPAVLILEGKGLGHAIKRSFFLTRGSFWRWAGVAAVLFFMVVPLSSVSGVADDPMARGALLKVIPVGQPLLDVIMVVLSSLFLGMTSSVTSIVITVFYLDARVRHEGHDLRMRLERLQRDHEGGATVFDRPPVWDA
jgi:hypothetical protein